MRRQKHSCICTEKLDRIGFFLVLYFWLLQTQTQFHLPQGEHIEECGVETLVNILPSVPLTHKTILMEARLQKGIRLSLVITARLCLDPSYVYGKCFHSLQ